jgi:hypothetical protein
MKSKKNSPNWKIEGFAVVTALIFFCAPVSAGNSSFSYPIKKHVTGTVMSVTPSIGKGRDGEIEVNERIYRVSDKTVMVDLNESEATLAYFKIGKKVSMIVNIYKQYNEALYIAPNTQIE